MADKPRIGDQIFDKNADGVWKVTDRDGDAIATKNVDRPNRKRKFNLADLECVDYDDGIWQEMERQ